MDEKQAKKEKKRKRPFDDAPSYMQPRKPVLEEPLMGEEREVESSDDEESQEPAPKLEDVVREGKIQEEGESPLDSEAEDGEQTEVGEPPYSPYFPRGIYEDAQAVEAYYGRGEVKEGEERQSFSYR